VVLLESELAVDGLRARLGEFEKAKITAISSDIRFIHSPLAESTFAPASPKWHFSFVGCPEEFFGQGPYAV
jgi:hypothetical protein